MQIAFFVLLLLISPGHHPQSAAEIDGYWSGAINVYDQELAINITFTFVDGILDGTIDIPQQDAYNLPVEVLELEEELITFQFQTGTGPAVFHGKWNAADNTITGDFEQIGETFPFKLKKQIRSNGLSSDIPERELIIPTNAGQVSGNLILNPEPSPLVILLSGSGSQNRDENIAGFRVFGTLAAKLFEHGYSTFRYDDRGVGQSEGVVDATLHDLAEDVTGIIKYLNDHYENRFTELILLGHSQGGLVASIAASKTDVTALIFMASPFLRGDKIIDEQIKIISEQRGISEEVLEQNLEFQSRIYDVVRSNSDWEEIENDLAERLRAQIDQLPDQQRQALGDMNSFVESQINRQLSTAKSNWFKSLIEFEPVDIITTLEIPMLAVFGGKDTQVPPSSNAEISEQLISDHGLKLDVAVIEDANHLFQRANTGMPSEYGMLERQFAAGFTETILEFLDGLQKNEPFR